VSEDISIQSTRYGLFRAFGNTITAGICIHMEIDALSAKSAVSVELNDRTAHRLRIQKRMRIASQASLMI